MKNTRFLCFLVILAGLLFFALKKEPKQPPPKNPPTIVDTLMTSNNQSLIIGSGVPRAVFSKGVDPMVQQAGFNPMLLTSVDFSKAIEYGIALAIMGAVFTLVVSPLIKSMIETTKTLATSLTGLGDAISTTGDKIVVEIRNSEERLERSFKDMFKNYSSRDA